MNWEIWVYFEKNNNETNSKCEPLETKNTTKGWLSSFQALGGDVWNPQKKHKPGNADANSKNQIFLGGRHAMDIMKLGTALN